MSFLEEASVREGRELREGEGEGEGGSEGSRERELPERRGEYREKLRADAMATRILLSFAISLSFYLLLIGYVT